MSGPDHELPADLLADPGVLRAEPLLSFHDYRANERVGGVSILPWRFHHRLACARGLLTESLATHLSTEQQFSQAAVRITKGRAGVWADLASAIAHVVPGGRILVWGAHEMGMRSWENILNSQWGLGEKLCQRARARVVVWTRPEHPPTVPESSLTRLAPASVWLDAPNLEVAPGLFSQDEIDPGSAALLTHLDKFPPAQRVLDVGCGAGHLGIFCALRWGSQVTMLDADARAVACAQANAQRLHINATTLWADEGDPWPGPFDLVISNPPVHAGAEMSMGPLLALARRGLESLTTDGTMLLVVNKQHPVERPLSERARVQVVPAGSYKILELHRG